MLSQKDWEIFLKHSGSFYRRINIKHRLVCQAYEKEKN